VVGDAVNVASRVEGQAKAFAVDALVAESVVHAASGFACLEVGSLDLRGKREKEKLFILVGDEQTALTPEFIALQECHADLLANMHLPSIANGKLAECLSLSGVHFPFLSGFYARLGEKIEPIPADMRRFGIT
jgi:adenylate cyclase